MDRQTLLIHGFVWLLCFASISMYISRIPVNSSWFVVYEESSKNTSLGVKYSLSKAFIDIHSGSFFSTRLLTRELSSSQHHHVKRRSVGDDCLRRKDGSKPLLINRRGILASKACPSSFTVDFEKRNDCKYSRGWAGYYCVSDIKTIIKCPNIEKVAHCDLGDDEPCHPHEHDRGCQNGLLVGSDRCLQKCRPGYMFPEKPTYGTCDIAGTTMKPPSCVETCQDYHKMKTDEMDGFTIKCNQVPFPITKPCMVSAKNEHHQCTPSLLYCGESKDQIKCKHRKCSSLPDFGILKPVFSGESVLFRCPHGTLAINETLTCTPQGWSSTQNICVKRRLPSYHKTFGPCINGKKRVITQLMDRGFPPIKYTSNSISYAKCKPKCCNEKGPQSSRLREDKLSCVCVFHHLGFRIMKDDPNQCCKAPSPLWMKHIDIQWEPGHLFPSFTKAVLCSETNSSCLMRQCVVDRRGCLGFNRSHYFVRIGGNQHVKERASAFIVKFM